MSENGTPWPLWMSKVLRGSPEADGETERDDYQTNHSDHESDRARASPSAAARAAIRTLATPPAAAPDATCATDFTGITLADLRSTQHCPSEGDHDAQRIHQVDLGAGRHRHGHCRQRGTARLRR